MCTHPIMLPLSGLDLVNDNESPHGLAFKLTDRTDAIQANILSSTSGSYIAPGHIDESTGLPTEVFPKSQSGNRQLYTRNSGLSGLYLGRYLDVDSNDENLANSVSYGRVVLVSGEATANDFLANYQKELQTSFEAEKSELSKRFEKASKVLRGEN